MDYFFPMLQSQIVLFLYLAIGLLMRRKNVISEEGIKGFVNFTLVIALPFMIFSSFHLELTRELLINGLLVMLISTIGTSAMIPIGKFLWKRADAGKRAVLEFGTIMPNAGFAGIPLVYAVFGPQAVFFASLFLMPQRTITWSAALVIFKGSQGRPSLKQILLIPGNIAVFFGILYMLLPFSLPTVVNQVITNVGATAPPLSLIVVGCMLAEVDFRRLLDKTVLLLSGVRLIIIPLVIMLLLRPLGLEFIVVAVCVVLYGMPVGVNSVLFAKKWDNNYVFAARCIFVTSALSIVTAPLLTLLL